MKRDREGLSSRRKRGNQRLNQPVMECGEYAFEEITERKRMDEKLLALHRHASQLSTATSVDMIAKHTLDALKFALGFDHGEFQLVEGNSLQVRGFRGKPIAFPSQPLDGRGLAVKAVNTKRTIRVPDTRNEPDYVDIRGYDWTGAPSLLSELDVPVLINDEAVAVLSVNSVRSDALTDEDQILVETLATHVASCITRLRHEETILESEEKYRTIFQESPLGIFRSTFEGRLLEVNQAMAKMFGYDSPETMTREIHDVAKQLYVRAEDRQRIIARQYGSNAVTQYVNHYRRKDGTEFIANLYLKTVRDAEGRPIFLEGVVEDITERKHAEAKLLTLHNHAQQLASAGTIGEVIKHTLDAMEFTLEFSSAEFWLVDATRGRIIRQEARGIAGHISEFRLDGPGVTVKVVNTGRTIRVADSRKEEAYVDDGGRVGKEKSPVKLSELAVPVLIDNKPVALLDAESIALDYFTDEDQRLLETLASHVASALTRLRHEDELQHYSGHLEELVKERSGKLVESEARYRRFFESSPISLWEEDFSEVKKYFDDLRSRGVKDLRSYFTEHPEDLAKCASMVKILNVNETTLKLYGAKTAEELRGELRRVLTREVNDQFREELAALGEGETRFESEFDNQTLTGDIKHVSLILSVIPGYEDTLARVLVSIIDLTERNGIQEDLRSAKERLEYVIESNPAVIYMAKPLPDLSDYYTVYKSNNVVFMVGFEPEHFMGMKGPAFWASRVHPDDIARYNAGTAEFWKEGHRICEYRFLHKNGTYRWIREEANVIRDSKGNVRDVIGYWTDITDRKQMEEQLLRSQRLAAIGETAAMVGHDLRNPLQGLTGALHLLRKESLTAKEREEMLQVIEKSVAYSDAIIRDLSDYSAEIQLKLAEATPRSITRDAIEAVKVAQNVTVQDLSEDQPTLRVDLDRMRRVFINLIQNAIDAMPQGGTLTISSKQSDGGVEITLSDTGLGMPEGMIRNIWKPLQTTKAKGMGLGLAICKRIVDAHEGSISVKSKAGEGTTVTIRLPIKPDASEVTQK